MEAGAQPEVRMTIALITRDLDPLKLSHIRRFKAAQDPSKVSADHLEGPKPSVGNHWIHLHTK